MCMNHARKLRWLLFGVVAVCLLWFEQKASSSGTEQIPALPIDPIVIRCAASEHPPAMLPDIVVTPPPATAPAPSLKVPLPVPSPAPIVAAPSPLLAPPSPSCACDLCQPFDWTKVPPVRPLPR